MLGCQPESGEPSGWMSWNLLDFRFGAHIQDIGRKLPLQYALRQVLLDFLERRNFQGTHVIQTDHMPAKGGTSPAAR